MRRYAVGIEYDGSHYSGWQRQPFFDATIQSKVECALSNIAAHPIEIICAGRTDAGVHAAAQVFHFDTAARREDFSWLAGANRYLPQDIRLQWIRQVDNTFHARYSALARYYRYWIKNQGQPSALWVKRCYWHRKRLDAEKMQQGAQYLVGEHDFSAFRSAECQSHTPWRFIQYIKIKEKQDWHIVDICGNAFLHHMVRNIVGTLLQVGDGRRSPDWIAEVLDSRDRTKAGITAPAQGLYLNGVSYPREYNLPETASIWLQEYI